MWKTIDGFEGYEVSDKGIVRNRKTKRELKPWKATGDYLYVAFSVNGKGHTKRLHRIVAKAFCEHEEGKEQVNHKDGDKNNNSADNLEWCNQSENMTHAFRTGLQKRIGTHPLRSVICLNDGAFYGTIGEASAHYGISKSAIRACCERQSRRSRKGILFRFADGERRADDDEK